MVLENQNNLMLKTNRAGGHGKMENGNESSIALQNPANKRDST